MIELFKEHMSVVVSIFGVLTAGLLWWSMRRSGGGAKVDAPPPPAPPSPPKFDQDKDERRVEERLDKIEEKAHQADAPTDAELNDFLRSMGPGDK